jgi:hypothetical protein
VGIAIPIRRSRPPAKHLRARIPSRGADVVCFILGATVFLNLKLVGDLPVAEFLLIPLLPILIAVRPRRVFSPLLFKVYALLGIWLFGQIVADLYHRTPAVDWMRGDAAIVFFAMDIAGLAVLLAKNEFRKAIFLTGFGVGWLAQIVWMPTEGNLASPWKFGYGPPTIVLVVIVSSYLYGRRMYIPSGLLLLGAALVNLVENYRSPILILFIIIALVFPLPERIGWARILPRANSPMRVAVVGGFALAAGLAAASIVSFATSSGLLSEEATEKNEQQAKGGGLLLGGRPEILVSARAVMDSPLIGHGSWARDVRYVEMLHDIQVEYGMEATDLQEIGEGVGALIPTHSHLMGAWVWAGILGAFCWFYLLWLTLKGIARTAILKPPWAPIYLWVLVGYLWDILFSPFGNFQRISGAIAMIIIVDLLQPAVIRSSSPAQNWRAGSRNLNPPSTFGRSAVSFRLGWRRSRVPRRVWKGGGGA